MIIVEPKVYRATFDNRLREDITDSIISANVSADIGRDTTWNLDANLRYDRWKDLKPYEDWIAPTLKVTYPDGTVRQGQLGLYLVMDSPTSRDEVKGTVALDARDPLYLLSIQAFTGKVVVRNDRDIMRSAREILDAAVLTDSKNGRPRYALPNLNKKFKKDREWPRTTSRLELVNNLCRGAGCYPLWTTSKGIMTTRPRGKERLRNRTEVRTFSANVPSNVILDRRAQPIGGLPGDVQGLIQLTPKSTDQANEILLINDQPGDGPIRVVHKIRHPSNKRSAKRDSGRQKSKRPDYAQFIDDDATAREVARAIADELSTMDETITLNVVPDPHVEYMREVIGLAIWDLHGEKIAFGKYSVHNVTYGFTPESAFMQISAGRVQNADDLLGG